MKILCGGFIWLSLQILLILQPSYSQERIILLSHDAKYIEMDPGKRTITDVGSLWHLKIFSIDNTIDNTVDNANANDILIIAKIWQLMDVKNPSRELYETRGLVVLQRPIKGGGWLPRTVIAPPFEGFSLLDGKTWKRGEAPLVLTWVRDTNTSQEFTVATYDAQYKLIKTMATRYYVGTNSCISPLTNQIYTAKDAGSIMTLDIETGNEGALTMKNIGAPTYFSKTMVASQGCKALIVEKSSRESQEALFYLYDFDAQRVVTTFHNSAHGEYYLVQDKQLILIDERQYSLGTNGVYRGNKPGRLHIIKYSGEEIGVVNVPEEGRVASVIAGGATVIYSAPGSITMVDLLGRSARTVAIPFESFKVGVWKSIR